MLPNLRTAIELRFGTQLEFAREVGIHPTTLNKIINGWREPTPVERSRIITALSADPAWLFRRFTSVSIPALSSAFGSTPEPATREA